MKILSFFLLLFLLSFSAKAENFSETQLPDGFKQRWHYLKNPIYRTFDDANSTIVSRRDDNNKILEITQYKIVKVYDENTIALLTRYKDISKKNQYFSDPQMILFRINLEKKSPVLVERYGCPHIDNKFWNKFENYVSKLKEIFENPGDDCFGMETDIKNFLY